MSLFARWVLSLGVLVLLAGPAAAQGPGQGPGAAAADRGPALGMLLSNTSVQKELQLSDEQVKKVEAAVSEVRQKHRADFEKLRDASGSDRAERWSELRRKVDEETREATRGVLQPEQGRRLRQIRMQARGADALAAPRLQEALDLTADQKSKVHEINEDAHEDAREIFRSAGDDRPGALKKLQALHKETLERAGAVLSDAQKARWKELTGEPFEIQWEGRRGGGEQGPGAAVADRGPALGMLLSNTSVQKELKLNDEQVKKVEAAVSEVRQKHRADFESLREASGNDRAERWSELRRKVDEETREATRGVLQPDQVRRLRQVRMQARGADALAAPRLQEVLDLTADQKSKVHEINEDAHEDAREIIRSASDDRAGAMKKLQALHKETLERACAVLTDAQKARWKELTGEPFEIQWEGRRGGGER